MNTLLAASLVVFAITLIITKSKILACKRKFVEERYKASFVNGGQPSWIHTWFHAMATCSMCSGFWIAIPVMLFFREFNYFFDILIVFGLNWLWHCLESALFNFGKFFEISLEDPKDLV
jgi:hypothetical protein